MRVWRKQLHKWDGPPTEATDSSECTAHSSQQPSTTNAAEEIDDLDALIAEIDAETQEEPGAKDSSSKLASSSEVHDLEMEALMADDDHSR